MLDHLEPMANPPYFEDSQSILKSDPHDDAYSKEDFDKVHNILNSMK